MPDKKKQGIGPSDDVTPTLKRDTRLRLGELGRPDWEYRRTHETNLPGPPVRKPKLDLPDPIDDPTGRIGSNIIHEYGYQDYKHPKGTDWKMEDPRGWKDPTMRRFFLALLKDKK